MVALAIAPTVSVEEYLHSVYEPDMDLVDGVLEDRNVGELIHWRIQRILLDILRIGEETGGYFVVQETRLQVSPTRFRVPDTCLISVNQMSERILVQPPLLCIEVLSPEDRFSRTEMKCQDYLRMGVPEVWIVDPQMRTLHVLRGATTMKHLEGTVRLQGTPVELAVSELFKKLD